MNQTKRYQHLSKSDAMHRDSTRSDKSVEVNLKLTVAQAKVVASALDLYTRLGIGQIEEVANLLNAGFIPNGGKSGADSVEAETDICEAFEAKIKEAKSLIGFTAGASNGIGHKDTDIRAKRSYEIFKVLTKAIAEHEYKDNNCAGLDFDGLLVRYTADAAPQAIIEFEEVKRTS